MGTPLVDDKDIVAEIEDVIAHIHTVLVVGPSNRHGGPFGLSLYG